MAQLVCKGAVLMCTGGLVPSSLLVAGKRPLCPMPAANIMDNKPIANILPFGLCKLPSNPAVAAATAAALGVLTPAPCVPATASPWMPGVPGVLIDNVPALDAASTCMCSFGGTISVTVAGQATTLV